jgi:uncharacterized protein YcbX
MSENIQIKKLYYSPIKSFNFIESKSLKIIKNIGIEHDRVFAFVRNKTKEEAIKFQEKQYLRNNQSYLSVKNTPILNNYRLEFQSHNLKVFLKNEEIISISEFNFENLQFIAKEIKKRETDLKDKEIFMIYNQNIPFYDMINDHVVSLINLESLRDFEARSGFTIDHERFRANIVIDGMKPFQELELAKKKIKIGNTLFEVFQNTPRCKATIYPYQSTTSDINVPQKLNEIYDHIDFGIYLKPIEDGTISLNNEVKVIN